MQLSKQSELPEKYEATIKPWFDSVVEKRFCKQKDGASIYYCYAHNPDASSVIVVSSGRVECAVKYAELIFDLFHNGHSVFIHDHRGQGLSSRCVENPHFGYVRDFNQYVSDFESMIDEVLLPKLSQHKKSLPLHLLAHSMGSTIGALLVIARPNMFSKAVFCSPMFGFLSSIPHSIARIIVKMGVLFNKLRGKQTSYFLGQNNYKPTAFSNNQLMSSEVRYQISINAYSQQPDLQLGGVTYEWIYASLVAMKRVREQANEILLPCQVLYSGADTIVNNKDIEQVIAELANCESTCFAGAMHELLFERDEFRAPVLTQILTFFSRA